MQLIDSHAHLSFFNSQQLDAIFKNAPVHGVNGWIMAGYDASDWQKQKSIYQKHKNTKMSFGLHPWRVIEMSNQEVERDMDVLKDLLPEAQACGETGLDTFKTNDPALVKRQEDVFLRHLHLNAELKLPLILHIVKAHEAALNILKPHSFNGIVHGYSGSWEVAKRYISLGYKISLGRGLFQKGYKHLKETALKIDLKDLVIESDAYVDEAGVPEDPIAILLQVAQALAEIKSLPIEKIGRANLENVKTLFG